MNRKEFLKMIAISPIVLLTNRLSGIFKSNKVEVIEKTRKYSREWTLSLPFGTIIVSRYQWGKEERTAYYVMHEFGGKNPHSWAILPESGFVGDTTKWIRLDISQEDIDAYMTTGKRWVPGHFEGI